MENVILGLLMIESLTIYDLNKAFKQGISLFYSASYGSLQAAVKSLLAKGLVVYDERVDRGRNKKVYRITAAGRQAFFEWMQAETPTGRLEGTALAKVYFLGLVEGGEAKRQILVEIAARIEQVRQELAGLEAELGRLEVPAAYAGVLKYQLQTLDYGLRAHAFAREWFLALSEQVD